MKENPYDNSVFFAKYGEMLRSKKGLNGAGEWREFQKLLPGFAGKRVLDLGCGYGWHCSYAAEHGAVTVLGTDISEKMIRTAIRKNSHPQITYHLAAMEDLDFADASFDVILSSLALHYIEDYESLIQKIHMACQRRTVRVLRGASGIYRLWEPGLVLWSRRRDPPFPSGSLLL